MADVINIDSRSPSTPPGADRSRGRRAPSKPDGRPRLRNGKPRPSKTALVLGGGGFTGAVYEIGAMRAFDLMAVNSTVNDFDIYVGTSAGSFVGAMLANGVTPDEMMRVLTDDTDETFEQIGLGSLLKPNYMGYAKKMAAFPWRMASAARALAPRITEFSVIDLGIALAEAMPTGLYTGAGVAGYVERVLSEEGRSNEFSELRRELYLVSTDLDTGERIVLGEGEWEDVPISKAVECSTALPVVYRPVELRGRQMIDGGIPSTTNVDVAVERGAKLIVVVNPLVPYVNDFTREIPTLFGTRARRVSDLGPAAIAYQTFKLIAHARLHHMVEFWQEKYPGVDIILVEPEPDDELMFGTSVMDFSQRLEIAEHGFASVKAALGADYERNREIAERHGIEISGDRLTPAAQATDSPSTKTPRATARA